MQNVSKRLDNRSISPANQLANLSKQPFTKGIKPPRPVIMLTEEKKESSSARKMISIRRQSLAAQTPANKPQIFGSARNSSRNSDLKSRPLPAIQQEVHQTMRARLINPLPATVKSSKPPPSLANNPLLNPLSPDKKKIVKMRPLPKMQAKPQAPRPVTPDQKMKNCLECDEMNDFISGLQGEIQRLQNVSNDLTMQIILQGGIPKEPQLLPLAGTAGKSQKKDQPSEERNLCPECPATHFRLINGPTPLVRSKEQKTRTNLAENAPQDSRNVKARRQISFADDETKGDTPSTGTTRMSQLRELKNQVRESKLDEQTKMDMTYDKWYRHKGVNDQPASQKIKMRTARDSAVMKTAQNFIKFDKE